MLFRSDKLSKEELHGFLIAYEMRLDEGEGTSNLETAFLASTKTNKDKQPSIEKTCTCKCEENGDDEEGLSDEEYAYFTRKLKIGKGQFVEPQRCPFLSPNFTSFPLSFISYRLKRSIILIKFTLGMHTITDLLKLVLLL